MDESRKCVARYNGDYRFKLPPPDASAKLFGMCPAGNIMVDRERKNIQKNSYYLEACGNLNYLKMSLYYYEPGINIFSLPLILKKVFPA
ncbi:MAG: hypothetical protein SV062_03765 [Thermodesulfobacteriota bacterium]|nr:hypothetical protein [Thermodesulfobacteriota bacterium]